MRIREWRLTVHQAVIMCCAIVFLSGGIFAASIPVLSYTQQSDGVLFTMATGSMKVKACAGNIIRVRWTPTTAFSTRKSLMAIDTFPTPASFTVATTAATVTLSTSLMKAAVTLSTGAVQFYDNTGTNVLIGENPDTGKIYAVAGVDNTGYNVHCAFNITTSEGVYGGGHYDNDNNLNRNTANYQFRTVPANRDKPIPFVISTKQWGLLWDNYSDTYWNFLGASPRTLSIRLTVADQIDYYLIYGQELDSIVAGYRTITGAAPLLPKKAYGFWFSKCQYNNQTELTTGATNFRSRNIPIDVIVQDWLWWDDNVVEAATGTGAGGNGSNGYWNSMRWDAERYATAQTTVNTIHSNNLLLAVSVWPTLGATSNPYNDFHTRTTNTGLNTTWTWPLLYHWGDAYCYDAYNPHADSLLWCYMNTGVGSGNGTAGVFDKGVDIWWFDGSEPEIGNGQGETQQNLYTAITSQSPANSTYLGSFYRYCAGFSAAHSDGVYRNQRATTSAKRVCVLTRSVYAGQQRDAAISWVGDAQSTWAQYGREMAQGMNFCAAGVPYWTTDVGAFYNWQGPTTGGELFTRWFQFGAFLPIFRVHGQNSGTTGREMWNFTGNYYSSQIKFDSLRYRLLPYIYSLAWKVTNQGYTIMRTLPFEFRTDANAINQITEYMFGPAFLVAPITTQGATSRTVYLPSGTTWYDFWAGSTSSGGTTPTVNADITSMPLLVRAGSIVPMGPNIQYANQQAANPIELRVYPGANGQFTLYEDEGDSYNYESGTYSTIPITYTDNPRNLTIGARSGSFTGTYWLASRTFNVVFVNNTGGHGVGVGTTTNPDCILTYTGVPITCGTGVMDNGAPVSKLMPLSMSLKVAKDRIVFDAEFSGKTKTVAVYDLNGKLLAMKTIAKNGVSLHRDFGISSGVYIVKVNTVKQ